MKTADICSHLKVAIKQSVLALAATAGLTIGSSQALTTTTVIDLGVFPAFTQINQGTLYPKTALDALPAGSILRSVSWNVRLGNGDPYLGDLAVFFANRTDVGVLQVGAFGAFVDGGTLVRADAPIKLPWNAGGDYSYGAAASTTLTAANGVPAIDLHDHSVSLETVYNGGWSGTITLEHDVSEPAKILTFGPGATVDPLAANAADIAWTVPFGTNVTNLAPTFTLTTGSCDKTSGGTYDFTNPVLYTVTDGATVNVYTVTVSVTPASSNKDILTFGPNAIITGTDIAWTVPFGSDVTTLAPTYTVSTFASGSPLSGTTTDFTLPQTYTITAQDTTTQDYTVTVTVAPDEATVIWDLAGSGTWDFAAPNWEGLVSGLPSTFSNGDNVIFDKTSGGTITIAAGILPLSTTVSATSGTYTFSGEPIGSGTLIKSGGGSLNLNVSPSSLSSIAINGGTMFFNAADGFAPGSYVSPNVTVGSGARYTAWRCNATGGTLTMNGGTYVETNGFGGSWAGAVVLSADSVFGAGGESYYFSITGQVSGPGGLTKTGNGILRLTASNTYTGPTVVTGGFVQCDEVDSLGGGPLSISGGGKVNLSYVGTRVVSSLTLGGVAMTTPGTYGRTGSGAEFIDDTYFAATSIYQVPYPSTGTVTVAADGYAAWATTNAGGQTSSEDFDNDGAENGIEYFMGESGSTFTAMPGLDGTNTVTWTMDPDFAGTYEVQTSPDLGTWTNVDPRPLPVSGNLSYMLPNGLGTRFVRLLVTPTPTP